jgi:hypothetical protein
MKATVYSLQSYILYISVDRYIMSIEGLQIVQILTAIATYLVLHMDHQSLVLSALRPHQEFVL